jgi:hypothetical protein
MVVIGIVSLILAAVLSFKTMQGQDQEGQGQDQEGEILLQPAAEAGPHPFISTGTPTATPTGEQPLPPEIDGKTAVASRRGDEPGLFGGTRNVSHYDSRRMVDFLTQNPSTGRAWAGALGISFADIPRYVATLTPVLLATDTRVTNHGFRDARAVPYQAVLQSGTAVLVDRYGMPRVRAACGNPLLPPTAVKSKLTYTGARWPTFQPAALVRVVPATQPLEVVVLRDVNTGRGIERPVTGTGATDRDAPPPPSPTARPPTAPTPTTPTTGVVPESITPAARQRPAPPPDEPTGSTRTTLLIKGTETGTCDDQGPAEPRPNATVCIGDKENTAGSDGTGLDTVESGPHEATGTPPPVISVDVKSAGESGSGLRGPYGTQVTFAPILGSPPPGSASDCWPWAGGSP